MASNSGRMQPVQDISVEDIVSRTEYQYSLQDPDANDSSSDYVARFTRATCLS